MLRTAAAAGGQAVRNAAPCRAPDAAGL